nr:ASCH domain protein [uncultured bacterium]
MIGCAASASVKQNIRSLPFELPEAWVFGATPKRADELLGLVLAVIKTGTASSLWEYEFTSDPVPRVGELSIVLDGDGSPRALIETTAVSIVPFDEVTEGHAFSEGEGDRTLVMWRELNERFWREHLGSPRGFERTMPVVCERFRVVYS